jgi:hypothetical protein
MKTGVWKLKTDHKIAVTLRNPIVMSRGETRSRTVFVSKKQLLSRTLARYVFRIVFTRDCIAMHSCSLANVSLVKAGQLAQRFGTCYHAFALVDLALELHHVIHRTLL